MGDILDYGTEDVLKFIQSTIKKNNNVKHDILDKIKYVLGEVIEGDVIEDYSSQGFYYERLWDLCIKFGATNLTLPAIKGKLQTSHVINENPNKIKSKWFKKFIYHPTFKTLITTIKNGKKFELLKKINKKDYKSK